MNDLVWCDFRHSEGAPLLLRPQSLQGLKCPASRPQPCIPVQSWKTLSIQRKLWSGCRPRLILQDRTWGVKDVSKHIDDTILKIRGYSFNATRVKTILVRYMQVCAMCLQILIFPLPSKGSKHVPHLSNTCTTTCGRSM